MLLQVGYPNFLRAQFYNTYGVCFNALILLDNQYELEQVTNILYMYKIK